MALPFVTQTRAQIRRHIGRITYGSRNKFVYGTATAGSTSSVTLQECVDFVTDHWAGAVIYVVSGTGSGQQRLCSASNTGVLTPASNFTTGLDATSVVELWPQGITPSLINDLITQAVLDLGPVFHYPFNDDNPTLNSDQDEVTLDATTRFVTAVTYYDSSSLQWTSYRHSPWEKKLDNYDPNDPNFIRIPGGKLKLYPAIPDHITGTDIYVQGYRLPQPPTDDTTAVEAHPLYCVYQAALLLESSLAEGPLLDPEQSAGRGGNWLREAGKYRVVMGNNIDPMAVEVIP